MLGSGSNSKDESHSKGHAARSKRAGQQQLLVGLARAMAGLKRSRGIRSMFALNGSGNHQLPKERRLFALWGSQADCPLTARGGINYRNSRQGRGPSARLLISCAAT